MILRLLAPALLVSVCAMAQPLAHADLLIPISTAPSKPDSSNRTLMITLVVPIYGQSGNDDLYSRVARVFTEVFMTRQWPVNIGVQRLVANNPGYDLELRVFLQGFETEDGNLTFRAWMILHDRGEKHDFGVIASGYDMPWGRISDEAMNRVVRGAALKAAKRIEGVLFQNAATRKR